MSVPVIVTASSVLDYLQFQSFSFQPAATNSPTAWSSSPLPAGLTLNAATGLITGAVTLPGVYDIILQAANADGNSVPVVFCLGIEASLADPDANVIDLSIDLGSREVRGEFSAKRGDDLMFRVRFVKGGVGITIAMTSVKIAIKELDEEPVLVQSSAFSSLGSGVYLVYMLFANDALTGALSNYEADKRTAFPGLWECEWTATSAQPIGPTGLRGTSKTFAGEVVKDLIP